MSYYLEEHPPESPQFRERNRTTSGTQVVHSAENHTDLILPDMGAEGVAGFISRRANPGSYATVFDSDSTVELMDPDRYQAFHDGTGTNRHSVGASFACRAHQWNTLPEWWIIGALDQAGRWWAMRIDMEADRGITVPLKRITAAEARAETPGFVSHAELDPGRRSDPGPLFPWDRLFESIDTYLQRGDDDMAQTPKQVEAWFLTRLDYLYTDTGPKRREATAGDRNSWLDHLRTVGHDKADRVLRDVENTLSNEVPR